MRSSKLLLTFLLALASFFSYSQKTKVDSLTAVLASAPDDTNKVMTYMSLITACRNSDPEMAKTKCAEMLALAQKLNHPKSIAKSYFQIGIQNRREGDYEESVKNYFAALKIFEDMGDRANTGKVYGSLGITYWQQGNLPLALDQYKRSLAISTELQDTMSIFASVNNIGGIYSQQGKYDSALTCFTKVLEHARSILDTSGMAEIYGNIGDVHLNKKEYRSALDNYFKSVYCSERSANKYTLMTGYGNIGSTYTAMKDYSHALQYQVKAAAIAKEVNAKSNLSEIYKGISQIYSETGDYKNAYLYYTQYSDLKDSLLNESSSRQVTEMQAKYDSEKKDKKIKEGEMQSALSAAESKQKNVIIWSAVGGLVLVLVFSVFILNRWRITQKQKKIIEIQKLMVDEKNKIIEEKNKDITDSINYAQRIQAAILPPDKVVNEHLPQCFVLYLPKDVVSGDFYFVEKVGNKVVFAAVDCTGHGVPGAMMSVVGFDYLNQAVHEKHITKPSEILQFLDVGVNQTLRQSEGSGVNDGMDLSLCTLDKDSLELQYAGAYNPLWLVRKSSSTKCDEIKADKFPIGVNLDGKADDYTNHSMKLEKGDTVYLFTDGFADQFGGKNGKKFKYRQLEETLIRMNAEPMETQKILLKKCYDDWKGNLEQVDDVLVIGVRV